MDLLRHALAQQGLLLKRTVTVVQADSLTFTHVAPYGGVGIGYRFSNYVALALGFDAMRSKWERSDGLGSDMDSSPRRQPVSRLVARLAFPTGNFEPVLIRGFCDAKISAFLCLLWPWKINPSMPSGPSHPHAHVSGPIASSSNGRPAIFSVSLICP